MNFLSVIFSFLSSNWLTVAVCASLVGGYAYIRYQGAEIDELRAQNDLLSVETKFLNAVNADLKRSIELYISEQANNTKTSQIEREAAQTAYEKKDNKNWADSLLPADIVGLLTEIDCKK